MKVLDIGAAPGSFLQYMQRAYGSTCRIVGADIQKIEPIAKEITLIQGDVLAPEFLGQIAAVGIEQFDAVTSDIAPSTTGIRDVDQYESVRLNLAIVEAILDGRGPAGLVDTIVFNAATSLWIVGRTKSVAEGLAPAREKLLGGAVRAKIAATREFYRS